MFVDWVKARPGHQYPDPKDEHNFRDTKTTHWLKCSKCGFPNDLERDAGACPLCGLSDWYNPIREVDIY
jgi:rubrerythrin